MTRTSKNVLGHRCRSKRASRCKGGKQSGTEISMLQEIKKMTKKQLLSYALAMAAGAGVATAVCTANKRHRNVKGERLSDQEQNSPRRQGKRLEPATRARSVQASKRSRGSSDGGEHRKVQHKKDGYVNAACELVVQTMPQAKDVQLKVR